MAEQEQDSMTNPPPPPGAHPMSTNYCAGDMDEEDPLAQHLAEPFSYMRWLLSNCYSPLLIEKHPELGYDCRAWRSAYEDLLRAQLDEPLMTMEEMEGAECEDEDFWTARVAFLHSMTSLTREERKKLSSLKEQFPMMPEAFREHAESSNSRSKKDVIAEDFDQIQKELKGTLNSPESGPWDELIQVLARGLALEMEERDPNSELDAYIEQWKDKSTSWKQHFSQMMAPQRAPEDQKPSALGMLTKTERVYNSDGTVTEKTVLKESFANNRTKTTETTKTTDENGAIKAETSSTVESSGSAHHWPQVEWNAPEDVTAPERHEPGAVLNALQSAQRRDRGHGRERKGEKKSSGWFWKN